MTDKQTTDGAREYGLDPAETECVDLTVRLVERFGALPVQHPDDADRFVRAVHEIQTLFGMRAVRRAFPGWRADNLTKLAVAEPQQTVAKERGAHDHCAAFLTAALRRAESAEVVVNHLDAEIAEIGRLGSHTTVGTLRRIRRGDATPATGPLDPREVHDWRRDSARSMYKCETCGAEAWAASALTTGPCKRNKGAAATPAQEAAPVLSTPESAAPSLPPPDGEADKSKEACKERFSNLGLYRSPMPGAEVPVVGRTPDGRPLLSKPIKGAVEPTVQGTGGAPQTGSAAKVVNDSGTNTPASSNVDDVLREWGIDGLVTDEDAAYGLSVEVARLRSVLSHAEAFGRGEHAKAARYYVFLGRIISAAGNPGLVFTSHDGLDENVAFVCERLKETIGALNEADRLRAANAALVEVCRRMDAEPFAVVVRGNLLIAGLAVLDVGGDSLQDKADALNAIVAAREEAAYRRACEDAANAAEQTVTVGDAVVACRALAEKVG